MFLHLLYGSNAHWILRCFTTTAITLAYLSWPDGPLSFDTKRNKSVGLKLFF